MDSRINSLERESVINKDEQWTEVLFSERQVLTDRCRKTWLEKHLWDVELLAEENRFDCLKEVLDEPESGCACGILKDTTFNGTVYCECHHCRGSWKHLTPECPRSSSMIHQHILACRFGGPRRGENCFSDIELEPRWTENEMLLAENIAQGKICDVYLDPKNKVYDMRCRTKVANILHSTKNKKIGTLAKQLATTSGKKEQLQKTVVATQKKAKKLDSEIRKLQNQISQISIKPKKTKKSKKTKKIPDKNVSNVKHDGGVYIPELDSDWEYNENLHCVQHKDSLNKIIVPIHCITYAKAQELKRRLNNYTDCLSSEIFHEITSKVYLGKADGEELCVNRERKLLCLGFDGEMLSFQEQATFKHTKNLASGTPIFNSDEKLCSVVLQSLDSKIHGLVGFYGTRGRISCTDFSIKQQEKPMIYGDQEFGFKPDLVRFASDARENGTRTACIWLPKSEDQNVRICLLDGNKEIYHQYLTQYVPVKNKSHNDAGRKKKRIWGSSSCEEFKNKIEKILNSFQIMKVNANFCGEFVKKSGTEEILDSEYFNTRNMNIDVATNLQRWFIENIQDKICSKISEFQERDSGFALNRIISKEININKFEIESNIPNPVIKLKNLIVGKQYKIHTAKLVPTKFGEAVLLELEETVVFLHQRVTDEYKPQIANFSPEKYAVIFRGTKDVGKIYPASYFEIVESK
ncbi:hypothetical protein JTB14_002407 [Gonioctena quinquepunctata]|nr:hypothetical protein JTB14_002407 [Gonioctena quinquepunctata]